MKYGNAISFFLSINHKMGLEEEFLSPNFLTYASLFKMFASDKQNNLYGVTGTIGEKNDAQMFLKNFYNVDIVFSPSFNKNLSISYPPILVNNEKEWIEQIIKVVKKELKKGRAVLIINEGIKKSKQIYNKIMNMNLRYLKTIKEYNRSDFGYQKKYINEILDKGEVIVTTNLGGRGTDIKLSEKVNYNGGMHVILTFLASNSRIEKQAFGRAARQGNRGSYQYIIIKKNPNDTITKMIDERNEKEKKRIENILSGVQQIIKKDKLFDKFLNFHREIKKNNSISILNNLLDKWGFFIGSIKEEENYDIQYDNFINNYQNTFESDFNIFYLNCCNEEDIEKAINICPSYAFAFFYNRALINLKNKNIKKKELYKYMLSDLQTSKVNLINNVFNAFTQSFQFLSYIFQKEMKNTKLNDYFLIKFDTINYMINNIDQNIEKIQKAIDDPLYGICDFTELELDEANLNIDIHFLVNLGFKSINIFQIGKTSLFKRILIGLGLILIGVCEIIFPIVILGLGKAIDIGILEIGIHNIFYGTNIMRGKEDFIGWKNFFKKQLKDFTIISVRLFSISLSHYGIKFLNKLGLAKYLINETVSNEKNNKILKKSQFIINQINDKIKKDIVYNKIINLIDFPNEFKMFMIDKISELLNTCLNEYLGIIDDNINELFINGKKHFDSETFTSDFNMMIKKLIDNIIYHYQEIIKKKYSKIIDNFLDNLQLYCNRVIKVNNIIDIIVPDEFKFKKNINQIQLGLNKLYYILVNKTIIDKLKQVYSEIFESFIRILNKLAHSPNLFNNFFLKNISFNMIDDFYFNEEVSHENSLLENFYQKYSKFSINNLKKNEKNNFENNILIDNFKSKFIDEFLIESLNQKKGKIEFICNLNIEQLLLNN